MTDEPASRRPGDASVKRHRARARCAICGEEAHEPLVFGTIRPAIAQAMLAEHPELTTDSAICRKHLAAYRGRYIEDMLARERGEFSELERQVLESVAREAIISKDVEAAWDDRRSVGERAADVVADFGGSWNFIGLFFAVLVIWMGYNIWAATQAVC